MSAKILYYDLNNPTQVLREGCLFIDRGKDSVIWVDDPDNPGTGTLYYRSRLYTKLRKAKDGTLSVPIWDAFKK